MAMTMAMPIRKRSACRSAQGWNEPPATE